MGEIFGDLPEWVGWSLLMAAGLFIGIGLVFGGC